MRAGGASALLSDSRMALHKQSPPGISSSVRIRRHRPWPNEMSCVACWKTNWWKHKSSSSSFTFVVFFCCFFVRFWFVGNWPPDHHWQLDLFQLWLLLLQLIRQTALLYRFRNTHCFTQEFTFLFLMCSVCIHTRMLDSRVRHACTPAGKRPIYCTLPNEISEPVASPCVPACVLCDRSGRVSVSARQPSPDANMRDFIQTEWELSLNSQSYKGKHKHSETPCESSPVLSCPVLATQWTLERTDRRTRCHRTHNLLHFSPLVSFSCFSSH